MPRRRFLPLGRLLLATGFVLFSGCASPRDSGVQGQGAGVQTQLESSLSHQRRDTFNDTSTFWALVVNNALVAVGLPAIGGLWWYKRKQMRTFPGRMHSAAQWKDRSACDP